MEESSERRRERLRALREEASLANNDEDRGGSCVGNPTDLPLPGDLQQVPAPGSPSPRFEFYTDPLAAFTGSQKKKSKNTLGSPFNCAPARKSPPSPFWQPDFNPNLRPPGNFDSSGLFIPYPNLPPPSTFSTPCPPNHSPNPNPNHSPNPNPNPYQCSTGKLYPGSFNTPNSNAYHNSHSSSNQSSFSSKFLGSGSFGTPGSADFNPNTTPQGGYNPSPSSSRVPSGFGSPQSFFASQMFNGSGSGGFSLSTPAPSQNNQGYGAFSTGSPQQRVGGVNDVRNNNVRNQNGMNTGQSQGSNRLRGSFMQSPGSTGRDNRASGGRDNRAPGRSGGRSFQRTNNDASAVTNPELFVKRSMLLDPWKDLVPVRFESVASRLNACSVTGSREWLPKSVSKGMISPNLKGVTVSASGPSLAESLAASYADAVLEEDGA